MDRHEGGRTDEPGRRPSPNARRRASRLAAALFACALGSVPAVAAPDLTPVTLPPVEEVHEDPPVPDGATPTTQPAPSPPPASSPTTASQPPPTAAPQPSSDDTSTGRTGGSRRRRAASPRSGPGPAEQPPATALVDTSHAVDREGRAIDRLRDASLPAARQFSFPLGLGALVLGFLALQGRLDGRDPKLARAPVSVRDDLLPFS